jgi:hypothetical protein
MSLSLFINMPVIFLDTSVGLSLLVDHVEGLPLLKLVEDILDL